MSDEKHKPWCSERAREQNGGCIRKAESSFAAPSGSASRKHKDRKDRIEMVLAQAQKVDGCESVQAWRRMCRELEFMTNPEAKMPRFNALLHALWIAASNDQT